MNSLIVFRFRAVQYRFQLHWIPTLVCFVLLAGLLGLGRWQWQRAEFKEALQNRFLTAPRESIVTVATIVDTGPDAQGLPIVLQGTLDNTRTVLLDNQMEGRLPGVHVLTPLHTTNGEIVLVNRGWMPIAQGAIGNARLLPDVPPTRDGVLMLAGHVYFPSDKQLVLKDDDYSNPQWPLLVQKIDLPALASALAGSGAGVELAPFIVRVNPDVIVETAEQMPRHWQLMTMSPEKHRAYAFQWYGLALTLVILYIVFSCQKVASA